MPKACKLCGATKPLDQFHRQTRSKDGHQARCKECACALAREWTRANHERKLAADRAYYAANKERWEARYAVQSADPAWAETKRERVRQWTADNREYARAADRERYRRNPEEYKQRARDRRARLRGVRVGTVRRAAIWARDNGVCGICGEPADPSNWHLDHIVPLIRGGSHESGNVQVAHPTCNYSKNRKLPWEHGDRLV